MIRSICALSDMLWLILLHMSNKVITDSFKRIHLYNPSGAIMYFIVFLISYVQLISCIQFQSGVYRPHQQNLTFETRFGLVCSIPARFWDVVNFCQSFMATDDDSGMCCCVYARTCLPSVYKWLGKRLWDLQTRSIFRNCGKHAVNKMKGLLGCFSPE